MVIVDQRRHSSNGSMPFDQTQITEFKEAFSFIDVNNDGHIDKSDLVDLLPSLGFDVADVMIEEMLNDAPGGKINFTAFMTMLSDRAATGSINESTLQQAFDCVDRSGWIAKDQFKQLMTSGQLPLSESDYAELVRGVEEDGVGRLCVGQIIRLLSSGDKTPAASQ